MPLYSPPAGQIIQPDAIAVSGSLTYDCEVLQNHTIGRCVVVRETPRLTPALETLAREKGAQFHGPSGDRPVGSHVTMTAPMTVFARRAGGAQPAIPLPAPK